jgi:hypothetical protein
MAGTSSRSGRGFCEDHLQLLVAIVEVGWHRGSGITFIALFLKKLNPRRKLSCLPPEIANLNPKG